MARKRISHDDLIGKPIPDGSNGSENNTDNVENDNQHPEAEPGNSESKAEVDEDNSSDNDAVPDENGSDSANGTDEDNANDANTDNSEEESTALSVKHESEIIYPEKGKPQSKGFSVYLDEETYKFMKKFAKEEYGSDSKYIVYLVKKDIEENRERYVEVIKKSLIRRRAELEAIDKELSEL